MTKKYTSIYDVYNDSDMYAKARLGGQYTLANFQQLAQARWPWIVKNWPKLKQSLTEQANGDGALLALVEDLDSSVTSYNLGNTKNNPFTNYSNFANYFELLQLITLQQLSLKPEEVIVRDQEIQRVANLQIDDFKNAIKFIKEQQLATSDTIGLGDETVSNMFGVNQGTKQRAATISDLEYIDGLDNLIQIIEGYIFDMRQIQKKPPNLLEIANRNIDPNSQVAVRSAYISYFTVPFELSLESMAQKYLGSRDRWYELATVNNLQPPFVDESGSKFNILAPGTLNSVIIPSSALENLSVGAKIGIGSFKHREETRLVEKLTENSNNTAILYLSGEQNINRFKPAEGGFVRVYQPGTTRKNQLIIIPSTIPIDDISKPTPTNGRLRELSSAFLNFGISFARDQRTRDLIVESNGNFKFSYGFDAIRAAVINAITTTKGELPFHPDYGVNAAIGERFFGTTDEAMIFGELVRTSIMTDPRFESVTIANLQATQTSMSLKLLVKIKGYDGLIPLSFVA
jgi:hypothetical protein